MSTDKSYVSMEAFLCPACTEKHTHGGAVLMDKRLKESMDRETITGWKLCEEHDTAVREGYFILVGVNAPDNPEDGAQMGAGDVDRTGTIVCIRGEALETILPEVTLHTGEDVYKNMGFMDGEVLETLAARVEAAEDE